MQDYHNLDCNLRCTNRVTLTTYSWRCFIMIVAGTLYAKSGRAVQISDSNNKVFLSADDQGATVFMLVGCRAWNNVSDDLRPHCYSLVDANRPDWYVRSAANLLRLRSAYDVAHLPNFNRASSFILHSDKFYPGYYALESVKHPNHYIQSQDDGRLQIAEPNYTTEYNHTASFLISDYSASGK